MANRVTEEDKIKINELYYKLKNKAEVARQTGFSASTVSKYIIDDYKPESQRKIKRFTGELPPVDFTMFRRKNWTPLLRLTEKEIEDLKELWEEMSL